VEPDGTIRLAALSHVDPEKLPLIRQWVEKYPLSLDAPEGTPKVIRTGQAEWVPDVARRQAALERAAPGQAEARADFVNRLNIKSYMIVPLVARERVFGAITFMRSEAAPRYNFQDLLSAEEIARRVAIAMDNAVLYSQEQQARHEVEANARRVGALQNITIVLATT